MRYRPLGNTGMHVSVHCLGTMMFGPVGNPDHDACIEIVHAALDAGVNFIDTADMYSDGECEVIVGKALKNRRDDVILATKGHFPVGSDGPNRHGNSRRHLLRALDASLERLQTDWIDLYQVHRPDPDTAIEETLATLDDCVRERSGRTAARRFRPISSSKPALSPIASASWGSGRKSRRTRCWSAASSPRCFQRASAWEWASSCGARSRQAG